MDDVPFWPSETWVQLVGDHVFASRTYTTEAAPGAVGVTDGDIQKNYPKPHVHVRWVSGALNDCDWSNVDVDCLRALPNLGESPSLADVETFLNG